MTKTNIYYFLLNQGDGSCKTLLFLDKELADWFFEYHCNYYTQDCDLACDTVDVIEIESEFDISVKGVLTPKDVLKEILENVLDYSDSCNILDELYEENDLNTADIETVIESLLPSKSIHPELRRASKFHLIDYMKNINTKMEYVDEFISTFFPEYLIEFKHVLPPYISTDTYEFNLDWILEVVTKHKAYSELLN